jgi:hypothetical protein
MHHRASRWDGIGGVRVGDIFSMEPNNLLGKPAGFEGNLGGEPTFFGWIATMHLLGQLRTVVCSSLPLTLIGRSWWV